MAVTERDDVRLVTRARALAETRTRAVVGICGAPGAGKSTVAERIAAGVGDLAVVVPMDGFHLHDEELARLGLSDRKGAPETFDVAGYVALLRRLRTETHRTVYAPRFVREREESVAAAIAVRPEHRLVITEGNYLLHDQQGWGEVRPLLDETWFVVGDDEVRMQRLVRRHERHGRAPDQAVRWATVSDQANAELVARTRAAADVLVEND